MSVNTDKRCIVATVELRVKHDLLKVILSPSMESELVALAQANQEAIALRRLLHELGFEQQSATVIGEDNAS